MLHYHNCNIHSYSKYRYVSRSHASHRPLYGWFCYPILQHHHFHSQQHGSVQEEIEKPSDKTWTGNDPCWKYIQHKCETCINRKVRLVLTFLMTLPCQFGTFQYPIRRGVFGTNPHLLKNEVFERKIRLYDSFHCDIYWFVHASHQSIHLTSWDTSGDFTVLANVGD